MRLLCVDAHFGVHFVQADQADRLFRRVQSPRPRSVLHSGFRGLKHARVSCSIDAYTPEEAPADEPNYLLTYTDSFPNRQRCQLLLHCTDAIVIPVDSLAELRQNLSPLMKVHKLICNASTRRSI